MVPEGPSVRGGVLLLSEARPDARGLGGVAVHVAALSEHRSPERVYLAYPTPGALVIEATGPRRVVSAIPLDDGAGAFENALVAALVGTESRLLHVHSVQLGPRTLANAARRAGARVLVTLHDHALACENYDLLERGERFCGVPDDMARCDRCLRATRGATEGALRRYRAETAELVRETARFIAPSDSVAELVARAHPEIRPKVVRMDWGVPLPRTRSERSAREDGHLAVAAVAVHAKEKGRERLPALLASAADLPVRFHVFGATEGRTVSDLRRSAPRIVIHGAYDRASLADHLVHAGIHLALLPSTKPETFSLVLSEVVAAGIPAIGSDFGALGERIRRDGLGFSFDPWDSAGFATLLSALCRDRARVDDVTRHVRTLPVRTEAEMCRDHVALWASLVAEGDAPPAKVDEARALFARGEQAARARPSRLLALADFVRSTALYRDLPLRRLVPERARKALEARALGFLGRRGRS